jgi:NAD(P)-dependent dehydrogenase (short-subunit alcohol dehydrogenase family)
MHKTLRLAAWAALLAALGGALFYRQAMQECVHYPPLAPQSQAGKTFVVTGGNSGLGFETSKALAGAGGRVVMACRSAARCQAAREDILREHPSADVAAMQLDLASFASVRRFAAAFRESFGRLDVLVNNAGIMAVPAREVTEDGLESQIGTNHFGHFLLTSLLFPLLNPNGRVVTHSSEMHRSALRTFPAADIQSEGKGYGAWSAYGNSKLANTLFAHELNHRLAAIGNPRNLSSVSVHPGYSSTNLQTGRFPLAEYFNAAFAMPAAYGALAQTHAAAGGGPERSVDTYYGPKYWFFGAPGEVATSPQARDRTAQARLWADSLRVIGAKACFVL